MIISIIIAAVVVVVLVVTLSVVLTRKDKDEVKEFLDKMIFKITFKSNGEWNFYVEVPNDQAKEEKISITIQVEEKASRLRRLRKESFEIEMKDSKKWNTTIENLELKEGYNNFKITATFKGKTKETTKAIFVIPKNNVNEIIIAPLIATMPVTLFTLSYKSITNNNQIPTYFYLERSQAWNYNNLPTNMFLIPTFKESDISNKILSRNYIYSTTKTFIKEIANTYPEIKINLYLCDLWSSCWMSLILPFNIKNYSVYFLTDGSGTATTFNQIFDKSNWKSLFDEYKKKIASLKEKCSSESYPIQDGISETYPIILNQCIEEENFYWWVIDPTMLGVQTKDDENGVYKKAIEPAVTRGNIIKKNLGTLFGDLSEDEKAIIKKLYKFSEGMFDEAENEKKNIIVFLGTYTNNENHIDDYMKAVIKNYGYEEYAYYYKGHPRDQAEIKSKKEKFERIKVHWLDATIAAELIYFFANGNKISEEYTMYSYWGGYSTSTFSTIQSEHALFIWNFDITKDEGISDYKNKLDIFMNYKVSTDATYSSILDGSDGILFEYLENKPTDYDVSLYSISKDTINHYKKTGSGTLEIVS